MSGIVLKSPVGREKVSEELKLKRRSATWDDATEARIQALADRTPFDRAEIARMCVLRMLPIFEDDPREMMQQSSPHTILKESQENE